jgi:hypothetical protein
MHNMGSLMFTVSCVDYSQVYAVQVWAPRDSCDRQAMLLFDGDDGLEAVAEKELPFEILLPRTLEVLASLKNYEQRCRIGVLTASRVQNVRRRLCLCVLLYGIHFTILSCMSLFASHPTRLLLLQLS